MKTPVILNISYLSLFVVVLASCSPEVRKEKIDLELSIIPQPKEVRVYEGSFVLDATTQLVFSNENQGKAASWFNKEVQKIYGLSCAVGAATAQDKNSIVLTQIDSLANEAYLLDISNKRIEIKASSVAGYFYGFQTLLQVAPLYDETMEQSELKFNQATITDEPRFKWRGAMLDISRHFFGPESIKQLIE